MHRQERSPARKREHQLRKVSGLAWECQSIVSRGGLASGVGKLRGNAPMCYDRMALDSHGLSFFSYT